MAVKPVAPVAEPIAPSSQIVSSRTFNSPRELLYRAWSEPEHLKNWWGPNGFRNTIEEYELKAGGKWRFVMHGPNGVDYPNEIEFIEVMAQRRIVFKHLSEPHFEVTATFEDLGGRTRVAFKMNFPTIEECEKLRGSIVPANEQNFDRLEAEIKRMTVPL